MGNTKSWLQNHKSIIVTKNNYKKISALGNTGQTFNDVITLLLESIEVCKK